MPAEGKLQIPSSVAALIRINAGRSTAKREAEQSAYEDIVQRIEAQTDPQEKALLSEALDSAIRMASMSFLYVRDEFLSDAVQIRKGELKLQRKAKRELVPFALFQAVERILAKGTNPPDNRNSDQMASNRWPLHFEAKYRPLKVKEHSSTHEPLTAENLRGAFYSFGRHTFFVGWVVEQVIRTIETRYGLDFEALEKARLQQAEP